MGFGANCQNFRKLSLGGCRKNCRSLDLRDPYEAQPAFELKTACKVEVTDKLPSTFGDVIVGLTGAIFKIEDSMPGHRSFAFPAISKLRALCHAGIYENISQFNKTREPAIRFRFNRKTLLRS